VLTGGSDGCAIIWDAESGKKLQSLNGCSYQCYPVFSPDGKKVVTTGRSGNGPVAKIWDAETGKELTGLLGHTRGVYSAAFSPDSKKVVTGNVADGTTRIWTLE
jgi:WD40 repeat protein